MNTRKMRNVLAVGVVASILATQCAFAYQPEKSFWLERRRSANRSGQAKIFSVANALAAPLPGIQRGAAALSPNSLSPKLKQSLPVEFFSVHADLLASGAEAYGSVRKIILPRLSKVTQAGPVVIHIQDVHQNLEAQKNIAEAVRRWAKHVDVIGLEGSTRAIDLSRFRDFSDREAINLVAQDALARNDITGPVAAALTASTPFPPVVGIDDPAHYTANIDAYRRAVPYQAELKSQWACQMTELHEEQEAHFSPELRSFHQKISDYHEGRSTLTAYIETLLHFRRGAPLPVDLRDFAQALAMEGQINFDAVERERKQLVDVLVQKLAPDDLRNITAQATAFRSGQIRSGEFYRHLQTLCQSKNVNLRLFPAMDQYVKYVLLADGVDAESMFVQALSLERNIYDRLATTEDEKGLVARSRKLALTGKLLDFGLTPQEWKEWQAGQGIPATSLEPFADFYKEAHARDGAMADRLLTAMGSISPQERSFSPKVPLPLKQNRPPTALLVTGGYHAQGIAERLTQAGVTVISFVPKIEKIDTAQGAVALSVFTQEKTPLQKLFEGEKLFLGQDPAPQEVTDLVIPARVALASGILESFMSLVGDSIRPKINKVKLGLNALVVKFQDGKTVETKINSTLRDGEKFSETIRAAGATARLGNLLKEVHFFIPAVFGVVGAGLIATGLTPAQSLLFQLIMGTVAGLLAWPWFRDAHDKASNVWLRQNIGKSLSEYNSRLFWVFSFITLATVLITIQTPSFVTFDGPNLWNSMLKDSFGKVLAGLVAGGLGIHGLANFIGRFFFGPSFVPAMAEGDPIDEFDPNAFLRNYRENPEIVAQDKGPRDYRIGGYTIPYPFGYEPSTSFPTDVVQSQPFTPPIENPASMPLPSISDSIDARKARRMFAAYNRLRSADERAKMALSAENPQEVNHLFYVVKEMNDIFKELYPDFPDQTELDAKIESLESEIRRLLETPLQDGNIVQPPLDNGPVRSGESQLRKRIASFPGVPVSPAKIETVHQLINFLHQSGIVGFGLALKKLNANTEATIGGIHCFIANIGGPFMQNGKVVNRPLLEFINATENSAQKPAQSPRLFVKDDYLHGSIQLGAHSVDFDAEVASPDEGGMFRMSYTEVQSEPGNRMRLVFLAKFMEKLGMTVVVSENNHLSARLDKDNGGRSAQQILDVLNISLRVFYFLGGLDYAFSQIIRNVSARDWSSEKAAFEKVSLDADRLATIFIGEGKIPFFTPYKDSWDAQFHINIDKYINASPTREKLRQELNAVLDKCELPRIPTDAPFGQRTIDVFYTAPMRAALGRGQVAVRENALIKNPSYQPLEKLAKAALENLDPGMEMGRIAGGLDSGQIDFKVLGTVGRLTAVTAQWAVAADVWVVLYGLKDSPSGHFLFATAEKRRLEETAQLSVEELREILNEQGIVGLPENQDNTRDNRAKMEKMLRDTPFKIDLPGKFATGTVVSPGNVGPIVGRVTFDRGQAENPDGRGQFYVTSSVAPDDIEDIWRFKGILMTGGNRTGHVSITFREFHIPALALSGTQWIWHDGSPRLRVGFQTMSSFRQIEGGVWVNSTNNVEYDDLIEGSIVVVDSEQEMVSVLPDRLDSIYESWRGLAEKRVTPEDFVSEVMANGHFEAVEFALFQAIWDRSVGKAQRAKVIQLLEEAKARMTPADQEKFVKIKEKHLNYFVERIRESQSWMDQLSRWAMAANEIAGSYRAIAQQHKDLARLARSLSLPNPILPNLSRLGKKALKKESQLKSDALKKIKELLGKSLAQEDLPQIRRALDNASRNGVPIKGREYQKLAKIGRTLADRQRRRIKTAKQAVVVLEQRGDYDNINTGGKFEKLGEVQKIIEQAGASVPRSLDVTTFGFEKYLFENGIKDEYEELLRELDALYGDKKATSDARLLKAQEIRDLISSHPINPDGALAKEIVQALAEAGLGEKPTVVRSAGVGFEDNNKAAFAGGARSFVNVSPSNVLNRVQDCWASFWLTRGVAYRAKQGMKQKDVRMSVILQEMVNADISGVIFTANPKDGRKEVLLSAGYGLGEGIERGYSEFDEFIVNKDNGNVINKTLRDKTHRSIPNPAGDGTVLVDVPQNLHSKPALSSEQIRKLVEIGNRLEDHDRMPLNIEYSFVDGKLYILQVRAITTLNNIGGHKSAGLLPLVGRPVYRLARDLGLSDRWAAAMGGLMEQGVLLGVLYFAARLTSLYFGLDVFTAISLFSILALMLFAPAHGDTVLVYVKNSALPGWSLQERAMTREDKTALLKAGLQFFGIFLLIASIPSLAVVFGFSIPAPPEWFVFAGGLVSSLRHAFYDFVPSEHSPVALSNNFGKKIKANFLVGLLALLIGGTVVAQDDVDPVAQEATSDATNPDDESSNESRVPEKSDEDKPQSPVWNFIENRNGPEEQVMHHKAIVLDWARELLYHPDTTSLSERLMKLDPFEAYALLMLADDAAYSINDKGPVVLAKPILLVQIIAALRTEFQNWEEEKQYGPFASFVLFGNLDWRQNFFSQCKFNNQWNSLKNAIPSDLKSLLNDKPRLSPPAGLMPLVGRPVFYWLIAHKVPARWAAGMAGFVEQAFLLLILVKLTSLIMPGTEHFLFFLALAGLSELGIKSFASLHGSTVLHFDEKSTTGFGEREMAPNDRLALKWAASRFFISFLVIAAIPYLAVAYIGAPILGPPDPWIWVAGFVSSFWHALYNLNLPDGRAAAMGGRFFSATPKNPLYVIPTAIEWPLLNRQLSKQTKDLLDFLKITAKSTVVSIGPGSRITNDNGPFGLTLERDALQRGAQVHVFERETEPRKRWTQFIEDNPIFDNLHVSHDVRQNNSLRGRSDAVFAFRVFASPYAEEQDRLGTLEKALDLLRPGGTLVVGWYNRNPEYEMITREILNSDFVRSRGTLTEIAKGNTPANSILYHGWAAYTWTPHPISPSDPTADAQKLLRRLDQSVIPTGASLQLAQADGRALLGRVESGMTDPVYKNKFVETVRSFDNKFFSLDPSSILSRLMALFSGGVSDLNLPMTHVEVVGPADLAAVRTAVSLLGQLNRDSKNPVRVIFAGTDATVIKQLQLIAAENLNVSVLGQPVAAIEAGALRLNVAKLAEGVREEMGKVKGSASGRLSVQVSPEVAVTQEEVKALEMNQDEIIRALHNALTAWLSGPRLSPTDFKTILSVVALIKASA